MKTKIAVIMALMSLGVVLNGGGMGGCSSSGTSSSGTPTTSDATAAQTAGVDVAGNALTVALDSAGLVLRGANGQMVKLSRVLQGAKSAISVTPANICAQPTLPPITGTDSISATIAGADFAINGTGSCFFTGASTFENPDYIINISLDCNSLAYSESIDGTTYTLGLDGTIVEALALNLGVGDSISATFDLLSNGLVISVDGDDFDAIFNLSIAMDFISATSATVEVTGCLSLAGQAFNASGSMVVTP